MNKISIIVVIFFTSIIIFTSQNEDTDNKIEVCEKDINCRLPFCNCENQKVPINYSGNFSLFKLPQLVVLTIDDDQLDIKSYQIYRKLLSQFKNPNNCSVKATFFVSDTNNQTSFCLIRNLYEKNHEIAVSSLNYTCPNKRCSTNKHFQPWDYQTWTQQIIQMKMRLVRYAGIPRSHICGFRAPILEPAADMHYKIIAANKFLYDSSLIMNTEQFLWPFTFDYRIFSPIINNGPINNYPGLWELPIQTYVDLNTQQREFCLKLWQGHCKYDTTVDGVYKFIRQHFLRSYYSNRAPVVLHLNSDWLKEYITITKDEFIPDIGLNKKEKTKIPIEIKNYINLDGLIKFINETTRINKDVYFVTAQQAIAWMRALPRLEDAERIIQSILDLDDKKKAGDIGDKQYTRVKQEILESFNFSLPFDLKSLFNEIFDDIKCTEQDHIYDGSCKILRQVTPDYDQEDNSFELDDNYESLLRKKLKIEHSASLNFLAELQSEILFINNFVIFFICSLVLLLIIIIIKDKLF